MTNNIFLETAIELSAKNIKNNLGGPFGAVVVKDGKIIGQGGNRVTSLNDPTAHAEIMAIRNACKNIGSFSLNGAKIYTSCELCPMCLAAIYWARISKIYYSNTRKDAAEIGFDDSYIYDQISILSEFRDIKMEKIESEQAKAVFNNWKNKTDRIEY